MSDWTSSGRFRAEGSCNRRSDCLQLRPNRSYRRQTVESHALASVATELVNYFNELGTQ